MNTIEDIYTLNFTYGPGQERFKTLLSRDGNPIKTKYFSADYEKEIITSPSKTRELHYISGTQGLVAIYIIENGTGNMYYSCTDHLGSITALLKDDGTVAEEFNFDPWGRRRNPTNWTYNSVPTPTLISRGFTGHEHLDEFSLINMNGRMYDPVVGRMLSPDNYVQAAGSTQGYNRYSYCHNNPLVYVDPDGNNPVIIAAIIIGAYLGGTTANQGNFNPGQWDWNSGYTYGGIIIGGVAGWAGASVGAAAGASALAGGASTVEAGIAGGMMGGMVSGGINGAGFTVMAGGSFGDVMGGMTQGAVMGGFSGAVSGGVGAAIGDFSGVAGSGFKNAMYEIGHSTIKGAATGLAAGGIMAAMNRDASYLWKGAAYGAAFGGGMAGLRIATMGPTFIPDAETYCEMENYGQVYRRGSIFTPRGAGITLGRNVVVKLTGYTDYDRYLIHHETGHIADINKMGALNFYSRTISEYARYGLGSVYNTPGTLEYSAEYYAFQRLGYYYNSFGISYTW